MFILKDYRHIHADHSFMPVFMGGKVIKKKTNNLRNLISFQILINGVNSITIH